MIEIAKNELRIRDILANAFLPKEQTEPATVNSSDTVGRVSQLPESHGQSGKQAKSCAAQDCRRLKGGYL